MNLTLEELWKSMGIHTSEEILQQPEIWQEILEMYIASDFNIHSFRGRYNKLVLTGAGTSAYIGLGLQDIFNKALGIYAHAIPTTEIVSNPERHFHKDDKLFLISFARSGNSPESSAAIQLANQICNNVFHLIITCNPQGLLLQEYGKSGTHVFLLPEKANDQGLAMTSSYTGMLLAGWLIANQDRNEVTRNKIGYLRNWAHQILSKASPFLVKLASYDFERAVFLGSGPKVAAAKEGHLKLQELTDGKIICSYESFLGFRHGPKAVVNNNTLMVYIISNDPYTQQYENDLIRGMNQGQKPLLEFEISLEGLRIIDSQDEITIKYNGVQIDDELSVVALIVPLQILAFYKSLLFGLSPDNPSRSGAITRVVEGVKIYPYKS